MVGLGTLVFLAVMVLAALVSRVWFRWYTGASVLLMMVFGLITAGSTSDVQNNLPTPWLGIWERLNITVTMVWVAVFALGLLQLERSAARSRAYWTRLAVVSAS